MELLLSIELLLTIVEHYVPLVGLARIFMSLLKHMGESTGLPRILGSLWPVKSSQCLCEESVARWTRTPLDLVPIASCFCTSWHVSSETHIAGLLKPTQGA